jgi:hypothetical protein
MINFYNVYLCSKDISSKNFNCISFDSFEKADKYDEKYRYIGRQSSTIYIPKIFPLFLRDFVINYKLCKIFIKHKIVSIDKDDNL